MGIAPSDMVKSLLDRRNFAHLATILRHGSPHSGPCGWEAKATASACTDKDSVKARNRLRDPRVAISIVDLNDPYSEAQLRGRVVERRRDFDFKYIDAVSNKYVGNRARVASERIEHRCPCGTKLCRKIPKRFPRADAGSE